MTSETPEIERKILALTEMCKTLRPGKYADIEYFKSGGARDLFLMNWGPNRQRKLVVKVDRIPDNPVAQFNLSKGYTTANELEIASRITHPGTTRAYDYFTEEEAAKFGLSGAISFEEHIPNSKTLEEIVARNGPLDESTVKNLVFETGKILMAINTGGGVSNKRGILHRDIKPSNILLYEEGVDFESGTKMKSPSIKIIDWGNSCEVNSVQSSYHPTAGGRSFTNPLLYGVFSGREGIYDQSSEAHSLALVADYAIIGKPRFFVDPFSRKAIIWDSGETLLKEDGSLDMEKYERELSKIRKSYPRKFRKYAEPIKSALTSELVDKCPNVSVFFSRFMSQADKPYLSSRLKKLKEII